MKKSKLIPLILNGIPQTGSILFNMEGSGSGEPSAINLIGNPHISTISALDPSTRFGCRTTGTWTPFNFLSAGDNGEQVNDGSGFAHGQNFQEGIHYSYTEATLPSYELFDLDDSKQYEIELLCTIKTGFPDDFTKIQEWVLNGDNKTIDAYENTSNLLVWSNITPVSGIIEIEALDLPNGVGNDFFSVSSIKLTW